MKRLITYLYDYESGTKGKGTGFIRVDQRGREIRMEVHVREAKHMQGKAKIYLIGGKDQVVGIYVGDITMVRGVGDESFRFSAVHMFDSGLDFSDVHGVAIQNGEGYLASNWREESCPELLKGTFHIIRRKTKDDNQTIIPEKEGVQVHATSATVDLAKEYTALPKAEIVPAIEQVQETQMLDESRRKQEIIPDNPIPEEISLEETSSVETNLVETNSVEASSLEESAEEKSFVYMKQPGFEKPTYRKIQLSHIRSLPPQNRHLGNNNFLRHGFFNYNYLILKKEITSEGEQWSIGVPGVYEQPERIIACMFGFPQFEAQEEGEDENPKEGTLGAWFTPLQM